MRAIYQHTIITKMENPQDIDTNFEDSERTQYLFNASQDFVFTGYSSISPNKKKNFFDELLSKDVQINADAIRSEAIPLTKQLDVLNTGTINSDDTKTSFNNSEFLFASTNASNYVKNTAKVQVTRQTEGSGFKFVAGSSATDNYELNDVVTGNSEPSNMFDGSNTSLIGNFEGINVGPLTARILVPMVRVNAGENQAWIACRRRPRKRSGGEFSNDEIMNGISVVDINKEDLLTNIIPVTEGIDGAYKPQVYSIRNNQSTTPPAIGDRVYELFSDGVDGGHLLIDSNSGVVTFNGFDTIRSRILTGDYGVPHISCYEYTGTRGISASNLLTSENTFQESNTFTSEVIMSQLSVSNVLAEDVTISQLSVSTVFTEDITMSQLSVSTAFAEDVTINNGLHDPTQNTNANSVLFVDTNNLLSLTDGEYSQALQFGDGNGSWRFVVQKVGNGYNNQPETKFVIQVLEDNGSWTEKFSFAHDKM